SAWPLQRFHDTGVANADSGDILSVNFNDLIAGANAQSFRRTSTERRKYYNGVVKNIKLDPDAVKITPEVFISGRPFRSGYVCRMRVKLVQNFCDRFIDQPARVDRIDILLLNLRKDLPYFLYIAIN